MKCKADNTAKEQKNQNVVNFAAWLVSTGAFKSVQLDFLVVGHTHNKVDQRFAILAGYLKKTESLQTPQDSVIVHGIS